MSKSIKLAINFDEISDDFEQAANLMREMGVNYGELRMVNNKNFVFWNDDEVESFKSLLDKHGITVVAAATPLFKWYSLSDDPEVTHDSFGFNPRLSQQEKRRTIHRTIAIASTLQIPMLRIFSELKSPRIKASDFASSELLEYALTEAAEHNISLLIENEPVCQIHTKAAVTEFLELNNAPNLKLWLDIANLLEIGQTIDETFLTAVGPRIKYIHVKNYVIEGATRKYVPAGLGTIDYYNVLPLVLSYCQSNVIVSVETHAPAGAKVSASRSSIEYLTDLLNKYQRGERSVRTN